MRREFIRELKRNIKGINRLYCDLAYCDNDEDGIGGAIVCGVSPIIYSVGILEPFIETPIRTLLNCVNIKSSEIV